MTPEKEARIKEMIREYVEIEKHIENDIRMHQARLDEHRKRRRILEEVIRDEHV